MKEIETFDYINVTYYEFVSGRPTRQVYIYKSFRTINSDSKLKIDFSYDVVIIIGSIRNRLYWLSFLLTQYVGHSTSFNLVFFFHIFGAFLGQMDYSERKTSLEICNLVRGWIPLLYS